MPPDPEYLSPEAFSRSSGISIATVRRRIADGTLPVVQLGGPKHRILIARDALIHRKTIASNPAESAGNDAPPKSVNAPLAGQRPKWMRSRNDS